MATCSGLYILIFNMRVAVIGGTGGMGEVVCSVFE